MLSSVTTLPPESEGVLSYFNRCLARLQPSIKRCVPGLVVMGGCVAAYSIMARPPVGGRVRVCNLTISPEGLSRILREHGLH